MTKKERGPEQHQILTGNLRTPTLFWEVSCTGANQSQDVKLASWPAIIIQGDLTSKSLGKKPLYFLPSHPAISKWQRGKNKVVLVMGERGFYVRCLQVNPIDLSVLYAIG